MSMYNVDSLSLIARRLQHGTPHAPDIPSAPPEWTTRAVCMSADPDAFFPEKGADPNDAKMVCARCPVRGECLGFAMVTEARTPASRHGVYGGLSAHERERLGKQGWQAGDPLPVIRSRCKRVQRAAAA